MVEPLVNSRDQSAPRWRVIGSTVTGTSHLRKGLPNQDAIAWSDELGDGCAAILVVSDGHGSPDHFRSHRGSEIAVAITKNALGLVHRHILEHPASISQIRHDLEARFPRQLVQFWVEEVSRDLAPSPFTAEELAALEEKAGTARRRSVEVRPHLAYGCTLLAILVTRSFALYLQLGDGDILTVSDTEEVGRPFEKDPRFIANETASLCSPEAWKNVSLTVQVFSGPPPALVLASTDGYSNSFVNEEAFLQVGRDLLKISREQRLDDLGRSLHGWLKESSLKSGDDVTLGIIKRLRDTDPEQISHQITELRESARASNVLVQALDTRLMALEESVSAQVKMEPRIAALDELVRKVNQLSTELEALAHDAEIQVQEREERKYTTSPWHRWSIRASWTALFLAGIALFCLILPHLQALAREQDSTQAKTDPQRPAHSAPPRGGSLPEKAGTPPPVGTGAVVGAVAPQPDGGTSVGPPAEAAPPVQTGNSDQPHEDKP